MAIMWIITSGFIISLGLVGVFLVHFLRAGGMHTEDAERVDPLPPKNDSA